MTVRNLRKYWVLIRRFSVILYKNIAEGAKMYF